MENVLQSSGLAESSHLLSSAVSPTYQRLGYEHRRIDYKYEVKGLVELDRLNGLVAGLRDVISVDLRPELDACYALGPYTVFFGEGQSRRSSLGSEIYSAKYEQDPIRAHLIENRLINFVESFAPLRAVGALTAPPKLDPRAVNLPLNWALEVACAVGSELVHNSKVHATEPQKNLGTSEDEQTVAGRVAGSIESEDLSGATEILVIDDVVRSGGTLRELGRALRARGAEKIIGLCVAKDAKFTKGSIDLAEDQWPF